MLVVPREYSSAADIISDAQAVRKRLRSLPAWQKPIPPPPPAPVHVSAIVPSAPEGTIWKPAPAVTIRDMVAKHYGLTRAEITGKSRRKIYIRPRHVAMYLCIRYAGISHPQTGRLFGDRDHTTVMHAVHHIERDMAADPALAADIAQFIQQIEAVQ